MIAQDLMRNTYIELVVTNFFNFITKPTKPTKSWVVTVFTNDDKVIDQIPDKLDFIYNCNLPCETCAWDRSPANPAKCFSCNQLTAKKTLFENQCVDECPAGTSYHASGYTCKYCDPVCLECSLTNA